MKPMTTISYDPAVYKLVPVEPTREMVWACKDKFMPRIALPFFVAGYKTMLAAVSDDLPGVVVHSGEPVAWADALKITDLREVDDALRNFSNDSTEDNAVCVVLKVLQAHPAPSQPSAEALVQAALEAALDAVENVELNCYATVAALSTATDKIRALSAQQIIEEASK